MDALIFPDDERLFGLAAPFIQALRRRRDYDVPEAVANALDPLDLFGWWNLPGIPINDDLALTEAVFRSPVDGSWYFPHEIAYTGVRKLIAKRPFRGELVGNLQTRLVDKPILPMAQEMRALAEGDVIGFRDEYLDERIKPIVEAITWRQRQMWWTSDVRSMLISFLAPVASSAAMCLGIRPFGADTPMAGANHGHTNPGWPVWAKVASSIHRVLKAQPWWEETNNPPKQPSHGVPLDAEGKPTEETIKQSRPVSTLAQAFGEALIGIQLHDGDWARKVFEAAAGQRIEMVKGPDYKATGPYVDLVAAVLAMTEGLIKLQMPPNEIGKIVAEVFASRERNSQTLHVAHPPAVAANGETQPKSAS